MSIAVTCSCGKRFAARDDLAGKRVKCPECQQPVTIPAAKSTSDTRAPNGQRAKDRPPDAGSVTVRCPCGRSVKAGSQLRGKRVKCPGCGQPLTIPAVTAPQAKSPRAPSTEKPVPHKPAPIKLRSPMAVHSADAATVMGALFDEIGFGSAVAKVRCPECKFEIDPEAVLCVKCGYHIETGKQLKTKVVGRKRREY